MKQSISWDPMQAGTAPRGQAGWGAACSHLRTILSPFHNVQTSDLDSKLRKGFSEQHAHVPGGSTLAAGNMS